MSGKYSKNILLVEDEILIAMDEKSLLERNGYAVHMCHNGEGAIQMVEENPGIDLVLMDINLGSGIDGTDAASEILKKRDIPVLFLSSHTEPEIVQKTEKITSYGYVVKNSGETVLLASIKMAFRLFEARTREKKKQEELNQSEQRFERMLGLVPDMISIHDPEMNIVYSNWRGFANIPELRRVLHTKCYKTYRGFDDICPDCLAKTVLVTQEPMQEEALLPDGRWVDIRVIPMLNANHEVELFMEWVRDITMLKQSAEKLKESDSRFQLIAKLAPVGILISDENEKTMYVNHKFTDLFGYTIDDMPTVDMWWPMAYPDEELRERAKREWKDAFGEALATGSDMKPLEYPVTCRDGSIRHTEFRMATTGEFNVVIFSDISERKMAQDMINSLLEEKDLLLRETHHRVRNNMYTLKSMLSLQAGEHEGDAAGTILNDAASRVHGMMILYDRLYRYGANQNINIQEFLPPLVSDITAMFGTTIQAKTTVPASDLSLSSKTLSSVGIIINELITNSMKYAFADIENPVIQVTVRETGKNVSVSVQDNGIGMPSSFDIENPDGFGLQMVKLLTSQIHGNLEIKMDSGTNTTVTFPA